MPEPDLSSPIAAEEIFRTVEPGLRMFVFNAIRPPASDDVLQDFLFHFTFGNNMFKIHLSIYKRNHV